MLFLNFVYVRMYNLILVQTALNLLKGRTLRTAALYIMMRTDQRFLVCQSARRVLYTMHAPNLLPTFNIVLNRYIYCYGYRSSYRLYCFIIKPICDRFDAIIRYYFL